MVVCATLAGITGMVAGSVARRTLGGGLALAIVLAGGCGYSLRDEYQMVRKITVQSREGNGAQIVSAGAFVAAEGKGRLVMKTGGIADAGGE